ncbi:MAG TPA: hypothetical protein VFI68_01290 [Anaerolineales bacterium]|nr:hypothetical protein [Anaerolineales bacterium]
MKQQTTLYRLVPLIAILGAIAAVVGLFSTNGGGPFQFTTLNNQVVEMYGRGLYQNDTTLIAVGFRVGDAFTLVAGIPLLLISFWMYRRGSICGGILLTGTLIFFLYNYGSMALGAAYNNLFLAYIILMMMSLFGTLSLVMSFDQQTFPALFSERLPRRRISIYLIVSGVILFCIWLLLSIVPALIAGIVPAEVASYTTIITFVVDMGIIAPALVISGRIFLHREPLGYILASILLVFIDVLGCSLIVMGIAQQIAGLMNIGQFVGFVVSFAILTLFSLGFTIVLFRNITDPAPKQTI